VFKEEGVLILTPEHVQIRLVPAGMGSRAMAWFVDFVLQGGMLALLMYFFVGLFGGEIGTFALLTASFVITWSYHVVFELLAQGRSPGKMMMGLRVVDERGLPISLQQSFVRNITRVLDSQPAIFYGFGGLVALFHPETRRLGDIVAGTLVVSESQTIDYPGRIAEGRQFNSLRNPRVQRMIKHKISLEEREFLLALCLRAPKLDDKPRFDLMDEVGAYYRDKLNIEDPHLSGENLVRGLTAIIFEKKTD
jgi:uncharacterized RDD family membrane protein YckC